MHNSPINPGRFLLISLYTLVAIAAASPVRAQSANALDGANALGALQTARLTAAEFFTDGITRRFVASRFELHGQVTQDSAGRGSQSFTFAPGTRNAGVGLWLDGYGGYSKIDADRNADDLANYFAGASLGVDLRGAVDAPYTLERLRVGIGLGYVFNHATSDPGVTEDRANTFQGALYASYGLPRIYLGAMGRIGVASIDTSRDITNAGSTQTAEGDTSGIDTTAYVELGGLLGDPEGFAFRPLAAFQYTWIEQDAFDETHAGTDALSVAEKTTSSLVTRLGGRISSIWRYDSSLFGKGPTGEFGLEPELHFSWNHEFGDRGRHVTVTDVSGTTTRLEGAESGRDYFIIGAGYTMRIHATALVSLTYDARIEADRFDQMARAGLMLHW